MIQNDGLKSWPQDTRLVFCGHKNQLDVIEEIFKGSVAPMNCASVQIPMKMPAVCEPNLDRYLIEYELRHTFMTHTIA